MAEKPRGWRPLKSLDNTDVEITPAMIEAGVNELSSAYLTVADGIEPLDEIVRTVFAAMLAARR
jgi:hypothetical protein